MHRVYTNLHMLRICLGIDVVRNRIKGFAQKKVTLPAGRHKIVILDEADRYVSIGKGMPTAILNDILV